MADMVVDNSGDIEDTKETARVIIKRLQSERGPFFFSRWFFVGIMLVVVASVLFLLL
jgi:hypothetical protein